jgi:radical SAM superfamily enzyme YgiQ (UPF0313 family)
MQKPSEFRIGRDDACVQRDLKLMTEKSILLIHPPVAKPSEPPAGIARLTGALRAHGIDCAVIDANIEGLHHLLLRLPPPADTWSRRAHRHLDAHLASLRSAATYQSPDKYRRAVSDINRLISLAGKEKHVRLRLANYEDSRLSPLRSEDLQHAARHPEENPYFPYYQERILPTVKASRPDIIGVSINFLSQALCSFALIGLLKRTFPGIAIVIGGGLITSWLKRAEGLRPLSPWVDRMVGGAGETALIELAGKQAGEVHFQPDYADLLPQPYLSPGFVLPFSASDGCWWRRCTFCPEYAEENAYRPLEKGEAGSQLIDLVRRTRPSMIHLLDNALAPALLKELAADPPGAPWYGFVRITPPLDDPLFCRQLARSGCAMLKIGLESGDQKVLDALGKGVQLETASRVLYNLRTAGIATYVYLLFGTPAEDRTAAEKTLAFTVEHHDCIDFLNLAIFNLPVTGVADEVFASRQFYSGDLQLYGDFDHPKGWNRADVRQFLDKEFKKQPAIQPILRRDPPIFTSNHAAFFSYVKTAS